MDNNYVFSAKEARELADSSKVIFKRIYKMIKDYAAEGTTQLQYSFENPSPNMLVALVTELKSQGYAVEVKALAGIQTEEDSLETVKDLTKAYPFVALTLSW